MSSSASTLLPGSCKSSNVSPCCIPFTTWLRRSENWKLCRGWKQRYAMACSDVLTEEAIQSMLTFSIMWFLLIALFPPTSVNLFISVRSRSRWCSPTMVLCPTGITVHFYSYLKSRNASNIFQKRWGISLKASTILRQVPWHLCRIYMPVLRNRNGCFRATIRDYPF